LPNLNKPITIKKIPAIAVAVISPLPGMTPDAIPKAIERGIAMMQLLTQHLYL
jgi:hypothetical protein